MRKLFALFIFLACAGDTFATNILSEPTLFVPPATLTIQVGVPLYGTWDFSKATVIGISASAGGSNTQFQYNNAGVFGGVSVTTFNGTSVTQQSGTKLNLVDPTD